MSNNSIWLIDRTLLGATTPGQSDPGNNGNERILCIPQISSITEASLSDCLGHSLRQSYPFAEIQSVYSTTPAECTIYELNSFTVLINNVIMIKHELSNFRFKNCRKTLWSYYEHSTNGIFMKKSYHLRFTGNFRKTDTISSHIQIISNFNSTYKNNSKFSV